MPVWLAFHRRRLCSLWGAGRRAMQLGSEFLWGTGTLGSQQMLGIWAYPTDSVCRWFFCIINDSHLLLELTFSVAMLCYWAIIAVMKYEKLLTKCAIYELQIASSQAGCHKKNLVRTNPGCSLECSQLPAIEHSRWIPTMWTRLAITSSSVISFPKHFLSVRRKLQMKRNQGTSQSINQLRHIGS